MRRFAVPHTMGTLALILSLASCGGSGNQENASALASLDTRLTNGVAQSNMAQSNAIPLDATKSDPGEAVLAAHKSIIAADESERGQNMAGADGAVRTLAAARGKAVGGCAGGDLRYGDQWAAALPDGLDLYPGARLIEAAGTDMGTGTGTGRCALRVISFTTGDSPQAVASHYTASVRQAGFDAERQPCRTEIRLGGVRARDDAAYMLFARRTARGLTEVDIVASAGPAA